MRFKNKKIVWMVAILFGLLTLFSWMVIKADSAIQEDNLSTVTVYSHDNVTHWGVTRWNNRYPIAGVTVACPSTEEFRMKWVYIEGFGERLCEDTGAYDYFYGRVHFDVFVDNQEWANGYGVEFDVYWYFLEDVEEPSPTPTAVPVPMLLPDTGVDIGVGVLDVLLANRSFFELIK